LLEIQGKEFKLTPIPLRTVRPFVIDNIVLNEVADDEGIDLSSQIEINKYLKAKVRMSLPC
jgi:double-strand break repair protein MRE11